MGLSLKGQRVKTGSGGKKNTESNWNNLDNDESLK